MEEAALYEAPFEYVVQEVKPSRLKSKREAYAGTLVATHGTTPWDADGDVWP